MNHRQSDHQPADHRPGRHTSHRPAHDSGLPLERRASRIGLRGDLLDFVAAPPDDAVALPDPAVRWRPGHWLLIDDGRISGVQADRPGPDRTCIDHDGCLVMPGFIDTHVHCPQLDVIASHGTELLDWLDRHTFPAEMRHGDPSIADDGARRFVDALLAHGTTAAMVFPTVHAVSTDRLFAHAQRHGMRLIAGKVLMDRNAPTALCDDVERGRAETEALIERWHGIDRLAYAVTVRFAITSSPAQMTMAGDVLASHEGLYMQTHVAENRDEVRWVAEAFPHARSYLEVYRSFGLLGPRSVLAHGIWLDADDRHLLRESGAQIAHCPTSNLFLGSGLFDWHAMRAAGAAVSVATDVGGGTSLSMLRTLHEAYKVQALQGRRPTAWQLLHAATRGAAQALHLDDEIGSFDTGRRADLVVWDRAVGDVARHRDRIAQQHDDRPDAVHERLFAWMMLGDERNVIETWVGGRCRHRRGSVAGNPRHDAPVTDVPVGRRPDRG